jgi:hypothetical protein
LTLSVATAALAATGVLGNIFAAFSGGSVNGGLGNGSRQAILAHGYAEVVQVDNNAMTLGAYYADQREIGFDLKLTCPEIPDGFNYVDFMDFKLEMTDGNGDTHVWERHSPGSGGGEVRYFPGGHSISDPVANLHEYVPEGDGISGFDFAVHASAVKLEDNRFDISLVAEFYSKIPLGKTATLTVGGLCFGYIVPSPDLSAPDEHVVVDGEWSFDFEIADKYAEAETLIYTQAGATENGIEIISAFADPTTFRITAWVDFAKSGLANPDNARYAETEGLNLDKLNLIGVGVHAVGPDGRLYGGTTSGYEPYAREGVNPESEAYCWFEIDSPYFDAPEKLTIVFAGFEGTTLIPLQKS